MHLVCCVGESVCATSHLLYVYPAMLLRGTQHPQSATKTELEMHLLAKRCKEMCGEPRKKLTVFFFLLELRVKIKVTLSERLGAFGSLYTALSSLPPLREGWNLGIFGDKVHVDAGYGRTCFLMIAHFSTSIVFMTC